MTNINIIYELSNTSTYLSLEIEAARCAQNTLSYATNIIVLYNLTHLLDITVTKHLGTLDSFTLF